MKPIVITLAALLLASCDVQPSGRQPIVDSPNGASARFMGTVDGCRLWNVDGGTFYFANCRGGATSTGWSRQSGKTRHYYTATTEPADGP